MNESNYPPNGDPIPPAPGADGGGQGGEGAGSGNVFSEHFQHAPVGARVPERVAQGVFATGTIVLEGPSEFIVDFLQGITRPPRVAARVILNPIVMSQFVQALRDNLRRYEETFGPPKPIPKPNMDRKPSIRDLYDQLKMADEQLSGVYATTVMIGHSPAEFFLDFITRFFPTAAVSARVYMAASQVPRLLETATMSLQQFQKRVQAAQKPPEPPPGSSPEGSPEGLPGNSPENDPPPEGM